MNDDNAQNLSTMEIYEAKNSGLIVTILQFNIEGISKSKSKCTAKVALEQSIELELYDIH